MSSLCCHDSCPPRLHKYPTSSTAGGVNNLLVMQFLHRLLSASVPKPSSFWLTLAFQAPALNTSTGSNEHPNEPCCSPDSVRTSSYYSPLVANPFSSGNGVHVAVRSWIRWKKCKTSSSPFTSPFLKGAQRNKESEAPLETNLTEKSLCYPTRFKDFKTLRTHLQ